MHDPRLSTLPDVYALLSQGIAILKNAQPERHEEFEAWQTEMDDLTFRIEGAVAGGRDATVLIDRMNEIYRTVIGAGEAMILLERVELSRRPPDRSVSPNRHPWNS